MTFESEIAELIGNHIDKCYAKRNPIGSESLDDLAHELASKIEVDVKLPEKIDVENKDYMINHRHAYDELIDRKWNKAIDLCQEAISKTKILRVKKWG